MKKVFLSLIAIIAIIIISVYFFLQNTKPNYSGSLALDGLKEEVEVKYDTYGIPHIYAKNEHDAYMALGYVHAQERLFQMEMIRRVATGTLSEILGPDLLPVDKLFRTLGVSKKSKELAKQYNATEGEHKVGADAYFEGINTFIRQGASPIEFTIIGIPKNEFSIEDAYNAAGYMSFGFAEGFKVDPILSQLVNKYGVNYLEDIAVESLNDSARIQSFSKIDSSQVTSLAQVIEKIPIPLLIGSNSWVIGPSRTKTGKPVFENDTHIAFSQPSVWFEAHLEYPGMNHYGHYLAGVPFALLGHNKLAAIGLTMFENDDVDLFAEKLNPDNSDNIWQNGQWQNLQMRTEIINIKGGLSDTLIVRNSSHGPIVNDIFFKDKKNEAPVAAWWSYLQYSSDLLKAIYQLNHIHSIADARRGASMIEAPGLNVMYADTTGNIAWWASAKLPIRPSHINSKLILNGSSGLDEIEGYYDFSKNPQAENPSWGYVYSANNQPDTVDGVLYPGYYFPRDRAGRIVDIINSKKKDWTASDSKQMAGNVSSDVQADIAHLMAKLIVDSSIDVPAEFVEKLKNWNGNHQVDQVEPSIHYTLQSWLLYYTMGDELGYENLKKLAQTSILKKSYLMLFANEDAVWWNDVNTSENETRADIISKAIKSTLSTLEKNFNSPNLTDWRWGKIHTITHNHPLGQVDALKKYFNVGPIEIIGGNEVINNQMFALDTLGVFPVVAGPAVRTVIDLSNMNGAESINPTGQSGNFLSKHYDDQAQMFANVEYRPQLMDSLDVANDMQSSLFLTPNN